MGLCDKPTVALFPFRAPNPKLRDAELNVSDANHFAHFGRCVTRIEVKSIHLHKLILFLLLKQRFGPLRTASFEVKILGNEKRADLSLRGRQVAKWAAPRENS